MTFQWTAVACFLYAEIVVLLILCIPGISPLRWQRIFMIPLWNKIANYGNKVFLAIIILLVVLFLDAVREVRKYSHLHIIEKSLQGAIRVHSNPYDHMQMKLFRSQRNLYISGFSLFLWLCNMSCIWTICSNLIFIIFLFDVLRRTMSLISQLAGEMSIQIALATQVVETNEAARKCLEQNQKLQESLKKNNDENDENSEVNKLKQEIEELKKELIKSTNALSKATNEISTFKMQRGNLEKEYDNLTEQHKKLQESVDEKQKKIL